MPAALLDRPEREKHTPEDLLVRPDGGKYELVGGRLVERDVSALSSRVAIRLAYLLEGYCQQSGSGWVLDAECGYQCFREEPNRVRKPDVSFIRGERLSAQELEAAGHLRIPPDLAVEVVSLHDTATELFTKAGEYLAAGVSLVWILDPKSNNALVYRADGSAARLGPDGILSGEDVLPEFSCSLADLYRLA